MENGLRRNGEAGGEKVQAKMIKSFPGGAEVTAPPGMCFVRCLLADKPVDQMERLDALVGGIHPCVHGQHDLFIVVADFLQGG